MRLHLYECEDAPAGMRWLVVTVSNGSRMPVVHYCASADIALTAAQSFWDEQIAKAEAKANRPRKGKTPDPGDVI